MTAIRKPYDTRERVTFDQSIPDPITGEVQTSRTKQSFREETDINQILDRYSKTGIIDHVQNHGGYSDMPSGLDYQLAMQLSIDAQHAFDALPAQIRKEFDNDPMKFLTFVENPENVERMRELGMLHPEIEEPPAEGEPPAEAADPPAEMAPE